METVNLEQLTDKIYKEAIKKARIEAEEILKNATARSVQIISDAQREAQNNILTKAKKEAQLLKTSTESELQLGAKRLVSDLKREITNMISDEILVKNIKGLFLNPEFFKEIILEIVKHWGKEDILELQLPESTRKKIDKKFTQEIQKHVKDLTVKFESNIEGGFKISSAGESYQISFTDRDFIAFFHTYLTDKTRKMLFGSKK